MSIEKILYDAWVLILFDGETYDLYDLYKPAKTRGIYRDGFNMRIKTSDIKISPKTYWNISGNYDHQFEGHDANCYLCGWYGMDYGTCKCKESFTVEEHAENLKIARKNYLLNIVKNIFPQYFESVSKLEYPEIESMLFRIGKYGERIFTFDFISWRQSEEYIAKEKQRMEGILKQHIKL